MIFYNTGTLSIRSEFPNLEEILAEMKVTPQVLDLTVPRYIKEQDIQDRDKRNQMVDKLLVQFHDTSAPEEEVIEERSALDANKETAIRIIQKNERGRQGIERAMIAKTLRKIEFKKVERHNKLFAEGNDVNDDTEREDAILKIQKYFLGYLAREEVFKLRQKEMEFLGITKKKMDPNDKDSELYKANQRRELQKKVQKEQLDNYKKAVDDLKAEYQDLWQDDIKDKMLEERRQWIREFMDMHDYKQVPNKIAEFYDKDKVKPPLSPEEEEAIRQ